MKKGYLLIWLLTLAILFTSCVPYEYFPCGVWKSEHPSITMYILPDFRIGGFIFPGTYVVGHEETKILVAEGNASRFQITTTAGLGNDGGTRLFDNRILRGSFRIISDDELHFIPSRINDDKERPFYDLIIFHRIEDYEPINPRDWGAHLDDPEIWFPPSE